MKLVIVESPAKSKTISKYLGTDYKVLASVGHVRDLPKSNKKAVDIAGGFVPHYEISKGKEKVVNEIRREAKKASEVYLATDPDREGEAIAWHIMEAAGLKTQSASKKIQRVIFHEITKDAVKEAFEHPREIDMKLKEAQEARRVLDRLVGYDLSGLIWKKVRYGLSAGRVQSPALRIIMEREREIRAFKPEDFWIIKANLETEKKELIKFECSEQPKNQKEASEIVEKGKNGKWQVVAVTESKVNRAPRPPFITSTLQQAASTRLGFAPARTMGVAQKLYEAGLITYMRTDSTNLSPVAVGQIKNIVEKKFGADLFSPRKFAAKSKNAQEAHEAIRVTDFNKISAGINEEQKRLYNLIWARTVASQMRDAELLRTKIEANISKIPFADQGAKGIFEIPNFVANGQRVVLPGWLLADPAARSEDVELPKVKENDPLNLLDIAAEGKQTEPPGRYSEAGLIKELEKRGIGRPSTYASIIKTIVDRGYVEKDGKALKPTDTGDVVSTFLENNFEKYISDTFTAEMEDELDDIASGKRAYEPTLREFYVPFLKDVKAKDKIAKLTTLGDVSPEIKCPVCGKGMILKLGRGGKFMSCETFPDCKGMRTIKGEIIEEAKPIGVDPITNLPIFILDGRFGPYVQLGDPTSLKLRGAKKEKLRRSSIPKEKSLNEVTLEDALKYLSLPRFLGNHPETGLPISANIGRFGPYVVHEKDFRSLKTDDVYTIELSRAFEIFKEPKKFRKGRFTKKSS